MQMRPQYGAKQELARPLHVLASNSLADGRFKNTAGSTVTVREALERRGME